MAILQFVGGQKNLTSCMIQPMFCSPLGRWISLRVFLGFITLSVVNAWAQTNEELFREYQFNFSLPGARANALGGAFIGLSDDATSSFSNPAGLAFLREPAITVEYRDRGLDSRTGELSGTINFAFEQKEQRLQAISFLSLNYRFKEWYFAVFGHDYVNAAQDRDFVSRSLVEGTETISAIDVQLNLNGKTYGVGIARRIRAFKVGLTLNLADLQAKTQFTQEQIVIRPEVSENFYASSIDSQDQKVSWTLGSLYEFSETLSLGAVYRKNPRFSLTEHVEEFAENQVPRIADFKVPFVVPDVFGVGVRFRPRHTLNVLFDWQHVFYSQIIKRGFTIIEAPGFDSQDNYTIGDINEFHIGVEWLLPLENHVWAFRGGYYNNPNHQVRYIGHDPVKISLFSRGILADEDHLTLGVGLVRGNKLQVDLSVNLWQQGQELTASFIWRKK